MNELQIDKLLKTLTKSKGVSIRQLCQKLGVTEAGLAFSLKNDTLKVGLLKKIADELGVNITYFFQSENNELRRYINYMKPELEELIEFLNDLSIILTDDNIKESLNTAYLKRREPLRKAYKEMQKNVTSAPHFSEKGRSLFMNFSQKVESNLVFWTTYLGYINPRKSSEDGDANIIR